jgi:hypothetical protein
VKEGHGYIGDDGGNLDYTLLVAWLTLAIARVGRWSVMDWFKRKNCFPP